MYRTYVAMHHEEERPKRSQGGQQVRCKPFYPDCAGLGLDKDGGHCARADCPVCTVFGFARGKDQAGGFAGLAAFTDAHVLLFPVPTRQGPRWVTCPDALRLVWSEDPGVGKDAVYLGEKSPNPLNSGWLLLPVETCKKFQKIITYLSELGIPDFIRQRLALVPDRLFAHIVNSNLEVRTSVSIDPETGAAEDKALFSYEALPRGTVVVWEVIAKNPKHFRVDGQEISAQVNGNQINDPSRVFDVTQKAHPYLEHLGMGGMGTRGMGRLKVYIPNRPQTAKPVDCCASTRTAAVATEPEPTS